MLSQGCSSPTPLAQGGPCGPSDRLQGFRHRASARRGGVASAPPRHVRTVPALVVCRPGTLVPVAVPTTLGSLTIAPPVPQWADHRSGHFGWRSGDPAHPSLTWGPLRPQGRRTSPCLAGPPPPDQHGPRSGYGRVNAQLSTGRSRSCGAKPPPWSWALRPSGPVYSWSTGSASTVPRRTGEMLRAHLVVAAGIAMAAVDRVWLWWFAFCLGLAIPGAAAGGQDSWSRSGAPLDTGGSCWKRRSPPLRGSTAPTRSPARLSRRGFAHPSADRCPQPADHRAYPVA